MGDRDPYAEWVESKHVRAYHRDAFEAGVAEGIRQAREAVKNTVFLADELIDRHRTTPLEDKWIADALEFVTEE